MPKTQTVPIERVREIARRRLELQSRLIEIREEWLKHCDRLLGMTDGAGAPVEPDEQNRNEALARLTERHASQVWEAIYLTGPAGEASVGPEAGSARPCSLVREAPLGGPVSEASERGAANTEGEAIPGRSCPRCLGPLTGELDVGRPHPDVFCPVCGWLTSNGEAVVDDGGPRPSQSGIAVFYEAARREARFWLDHPEAHTAERAAGWLERFADALDAYVSRENVQETGTTEPRDPTTIPVSPASSAGLAELDWLVCEAGISPPELARRVSQRVERDAGLWDRIVGGDLLNDDQAITLIVVLCQELMASVGHLRPLNVRVSYHLELRELNQKR